MALRFAVNGARAEPGLRLAAGVWVLWGHRGSWAEGRDWIGQLLALPGAANCLEARADALSAAGQMAFQQGDYVAGQFLLTDAVQLHRQVGDKRGLAMAVTHARLIARGLGRYAAARALHEEAVALARACGNRGYAGTNLAAMAYAAYLQGEHEVAGSLGKESLAILSALPSGSRLDGATIAHYVLGRVALCSDTFAEAIHHFSESLALWRATGDARTAPAAWLVWAASPWPRAAGTTHASAWWMALKSATSSAHWLVSSSRSRGSRFWQPLSIAVSKRLLSCARRRRSERPWEHPRSPAEHEFLDRWLAPARRILGEDATRGCPFSMRGSIDRRSYCAGTRATPALAALESELRCAERCRCCHCHGASNDSVIVSPPDCRDWAAWRKPQHLAYKLQQSRLLRVSLTDDLVEAHQPHACR